MREEKCNIYITYIYNCINTDQVIHWENVYIWLSKQECIICILKSKNKPEYSDLPWTQNYSIGLGGKGPLEIISSNPSLATAGSAKAGFSGWYPVRFWVSPQMEVVDWWLLIRKIVFLFTHWDLLIIILMYENEHRLLHSHILLIRTHNKGLWSCFTERESKLQAAS